MTPWKFDPLVWDFSRLKNELPRFEPTRGLASAEGGWYLKQSDSWTQLYNTYMMVLNLVPGVRIAVATY